MKQIDHDQSPRDVLSKERLRQLIIWYFLKGVVFIGRTKNTRKNRVSNQRATSELRDSCQQNEHEYLSSKDFKVSLSVDRRLCEGSSFRRDPFDPRDSISRQGDLGGHLGGHCRRACLIPAVSFRRARCMGLRSKVQWLFAASSFRGSPVLESKVTHVVDFQS